MIGIYVSSITEEAECPILVEAIAKDLDFVLFCNETCRIRNNNVVIMHAFDLWKFNNPVIATCEVTTRLLNQCPCPTKKYTTCRSVQFDGILGIDSLEEINNAKKA